MQAVETPQPDKPNAGDLIAKYWPIVVGLAALLYSGIVRDDRATRAAIDFYTFAKEQAKVNSDQAATNSRLTTLLEGQNERLKRVEDRR